MQYEWKNFGWKSSWQRLVSIVTWIKPYESEETKNNATKQWHRFSAVKHEFFIISSFHQSQLTEFAKYCSSSYYFFFLLNKVEKQFVENWKTTCHPKMLLRSTHIGCTHLEWMVFHLSRLQAILRKWTWRHWHIIVECRCGKSLKIKIYHFFVMQSITELESSMFRFCSPSLLHFVH